MSYSQTSSPTVFNQTAGYGSTKWSNLGPNAILNLAGTNSWLVQVSRFSFNIPLNASTTNSYAVPGDWDMTLTFPGAVYKSSYEYWRVFPGFLGTGANNTNQQNMDTTNSNPTYLSFYTGVGTYPVTVNISTLTPAMINDPTTSLYFWVASLGTAPLELDLNGINLTVYYNWSPPVPPPPPGPGTNVRVGTTWGVVR